MREHPVWSYEPITVSNLKKVRAFYEKHALEHDKGSQADNEGNKKALEVLDNLDAYRLVGGALFVKDEVVGVSLGENVGDTLYVHAEKADIEFHGSYPMVVNQFAKMFSTDETVYINREEDDGVEGLRVSKLSYHPVMLLDKYIVDLR